MRNLNRRSLRFAGIATFVAAFAVAACQPVQIPDIPGIPDELREIPEVLEGWELPDAGSLELPSLSLLPDLSPGDRDILYRGPMTRLLEIGEALPGSDVVVKGTEDGTALFLVMEMNSPKRVGDSVEFSGEWPGIAGSHYDARLRIVWIGDSGVRLAGVHQLLVPEIDPVDGDAPSGETTLRFPFVDGVVVGDDRLDGTTLGYLGKYERGAQFTGLPPNEYPYRQVADSLVWEGALRPDVGVEYDLRVLRFGVEGVRVAGTVNLTLP